ncbi:oxalate:formate antiporter [Echinococcus multilocularis]|uniref:Oxalate:formate antiporter n=2 Tax=Echinococcus multilocularis TaxID=6211 RepID=A0A068Y3N5_ECHMU|nr:oxalate:formate antiporter [Echinococcus multilocularis]
MASVWAFLTVLGAALIHLSLGYNYTVGNMNAYLIPYMNITSGQTVWIHAVVISGQAIAMPLGGLLTSKIGFRIVVAVGCLLCSGGVALSSLTVQHGLGPFIFTYAVMFGVGMGLPYSVLFTLAADWFPNHRAVVTGIILGGLGMGALLFTPTQTALINPNNLPNSDPSVLGRVTRSFLILAAVMFVLQIIGFSLLRKSPSSAKADDDVFSESDNSEMEYQDASQGLDKDDSEVAVKIESSDIHNIYNYTIQEALKTIDFYTIAVIIFLDTVPITLQSSAYKVFGSEHKLEDRYLSTIATCTAIFNCSGRVIWGLICDHVSFKIPLGWFLMQWAILFGTFPLVAETEVFRYLFPVWVFLLFFSMAGHFVLMPAACSRIFGPKNTATTYGLLYFTTCPSALILAAIVSQYDIKKNFPLTFYCCCALCLVSFALSLFLKDKFGKWRDVTRLCTNACNICRYEPPTAREMEDDGSAELSVVTDTKIYDN